MNTSKCLPHHKVLASWQIHTYKHHYLCHCISTHLSHWFVLANQKGKDPEMDSQRAHWILYLTCGLYPNSHCSQWFWVSYPKEPVQIIKYLVKLYIYIYSDPIKSRKKSQKKISHIVKKHTYRNSKFPRVVCAGNLVQFSNSFCPIQVIRLSTWFLSTWSWKNPSPVIISFLCPLPYWFNRLITKENTLSRTEKNIYICIYIYFES